MSGPLIYREGDNSPWHAVPPQTYCEVTNPLHPTERRGPMTGFWGAQPDQLRELGSLMSARSSRIGALFAALDGAVLEAAQWSGPDADSFRALYTGTARSSAESLASALSARSVQLASEADKPVGQSSSQHSAGTVS